MKKLLLLLILILPVFCMGQSVESKVDDFTGEKVITTSWEKIHTGGLTGKNQTRIRFRHENNKDFIEFRLFTDCVTSCNKGDEVLIKTNNGLVRLSNSAYTLSKPGDWAPSAINSKQGIYLICYGDMTKLKDCKAEKIRFYLTDGYRDIELKEKDSEMLSKLYNAFITELLKSKYK